MIGTITRDRIKDRLRGNPHLLPIFTSSHCIPERLYAYDPNIFVVWNTKNHTYEVHSLAHQGSTYGMTIPYDELDGRVETLVKKSDLRMRGLQIFREMDEQNAALERSVERQRRNEINVIAREMAPAFRKMAWEEL